MTLIDHASVSYLPAEFRPWAWQILVENVAHAVDDVLRIGGKLLPSPDESKASLARTADGVRFFFFPKEHAGADPQICELYHVEDLDMARCDLAAMELQTSRIEAGCPWGEYFWAENPFRKRFYVYRLFREYLPID